jgi:hypothetical protein
MNKVKYERIEKQYDGWLSYYAENKARGEGAIDFVIAGNQWQGEIAAKRSASNKESLTFNLSIKHLRRAHTQMGEIEFNLDLSPTNDKYNDNITEQAAFRLLLDSILLNNDVLDKLNMAGKKCLNYGMSFCEVNFGYEDARTANLEPKLIVHKDPSIAFWDKNAMHPTRVDGRFAGFCRTLTARELIEKYPALKKANWLKRKDNKVFDYWWREGTNADFVTLTTGVQKRIDLLSADDEEMVQKDEMGQTEITTRRVEEIYYQRICKDKVLEQPRRFPTDDLPIVYHPGLTDWHPTKGDITMPYCEHLEGAQKLHNYLMSQVATQAKNCNGDVWIFQPGHVTTQTHRDNAANINQREGGVTFGGDTSTIRREQAAQISQSLIEMSQVSKQELDEINGAMVDTQNAQQTVIAASALDKITHNMEAINMYFMEGHIIFVNQIGKLYRQMIPNLYTQERTLMVKKKDGTGQAVVINQDAGTGELVNNIKDINNNFHYEIHAGPSSTMQKENTVKYLMETYQIDPTMFKATAHIFFRNLQTKDSGELARIAMAMGDENLIKYSQGEISLDDYKALKEKAMQQQMQQQQQMSQMDPQVQSANAIAAAEHRKASADEFNAQTKRMQILNDAQQKQNEFKLKVVDTLLNDGLQNRQQDLSELAHQMDQNQQVIDAMRSQQEMEMAQEKQAQEAKQQAQQNATQPEPAVY